MDWLFELQSLIKGSNMAHPFALSLYFADGHSEGVRIIENFNWNGHCLICPQRLFLANRIRIEFSKPGIYILIGENHAGKQIYIGEGDPILPRLDEHYRKKDWWDNVIIFTSKGKNLNKAYIQFLEARLIREVNKAKRFTVTNATQPSDPSLSEMDQSICEGFLREMLLCLPLSGIHLVGDSQQLENTDKMEFFIRAKGIIARGFESTDGFVVKTGSYAVIDETSAIPVSISALRKDLIERLILKPEIDNKLRFSEDYLFSSPSTASSVVLGCSSNGRDVWKSSSGETLKSIQLSRLDR